MKKLIFALILLLATPLYASQLTTNYNLEIPAIGDRDWQPIISKDIISIDTVVGIISSDSIKVKFISSDVADLKLKTTIISNDFVTQDVKIQIISNDTIIQNLNTTIISSDVGVLKFVVPIISSDVGVLKVSIPSLPLPIANGGTGSAIGYTVVSNDVGTLKTKVTIISSDAVNQFVKGWANVTYAAGTPTLNDSYNVSGIVDDAAGTITITWDRDFSTTNYSAIGTAQDSAHTAMVGSNSLATTGCQFTISNPDTGVLRDPITTLCVLAIGDN